jgi:5'-3' exoribonuclease 2
MNTCPQWEGLVVLFSDAFVPGEGEHKILDFIRSQRAQEAYNPNTSHCIYGGDADLIMLGLSTHEAHFFVLREAFANPKDLTCFKCGQKGHRVYECGNGYTDDPTRLAKVVEFQFVKIAVVREYLLLEFKDLKIPFGFDFERIVDDFVFLCFFVGNDFLPHLPSLQIREGALDAIMFMYKNLLPAMAGYLTNQDKILFSNCDVLFKDIAKYEDEFFKEQQWKIQR